MAVCPVPHLGEDRIDITTPTFRGRTMYDSQPSPDHSVRKSARMLVNAEVTLRQTGNPRYCVSVHDISRHGCRIEFVDQPNLGDQVRVRFEGLETLAATVCWVEGFVGGLKFEKPLHPAVFTALARQHSR